MNDLKIGDKLRFPDGTEWVFIRYLDDMALIAGLGDKPEVRAVCACCTPNLSALRVLPPIPVIPPAPPAA